MNNEMIIYIIILLSGVFIAAVSQVMLKKAAMQNHESGLKEYLNPLVVFAYVLFMGTTFISVFAYKVVPLSMGLILEGTSYIWVTIFGVTIFKEKVTKRKMLALAIIIVGIVVYALWG